jgi:hypothetical protein
MTLGHLVGAELGGGQAVSPFADLRWVLANQSPCPAYGHNHTENLVDYRNSHAETVVIIITFITAIVVVDVLFTYPILMIAVVPIPVVVLPAISIPPLIPLLTPIFLARFVAVLVGVALALLPTVMVPWRGFGVLMINLVIPPVFAALAVSVCPSVAPECQRKSNHCDAHY